MITVEKYLRCEFTMSILKIFIIASTASIFSAVCRGSNTSEEMLSVYENGVRSLSELPIEKLMQLKLSFTPDLLTDEMSPKIADVEGRTFSMRLPFGKSVKEVTKRYEHEEEHEESKISKILHLSLTALSLLAFGGYILTLIISAVKRNNMMPNGGNVIILSNVRRPKRKITVYDPAENDYDMENLYRGMIMLSSDLAMYNKI